MYDDKNAFPLRYDDVITFLDSLKKGGIINSVFLYYM